MSNTRAPQPLPDVVQCTYIDSIEKAYQVLGFPPSESPREGSRAAPPDWRNELNDELRQNLVHKFAHAILPNLDEMDPRNRQRIKSIRFARFVESESYYLSRSREQYHYRMAETLCGYCKKMQRIQEVKRQHRWDPGILERFCNGEY